MATRTGTRKSNPALVRLLETARRTGCPADQLRHFAAGRYVPQPKQLEFHAVARLCDRPDGPTEVGMGGARGGSKSHTVFSQMCLDDCQRTPGLKALYLRKVGVRAREQFEDLRRAVLHSTPHKYRSHQGTVTFPNGSRVVIGHFNNESDVDNYLGIQYDVMAIEECTALTSTKYQALRDSCRTSKPGWRPRIYNTTNPGGVGHVWYKRTFILPFRAGTETFTRFIPSTVDDNKFVNEEYRLNLEKNVGWRLRAYRYGDWDIAAGQFFTTWMHDVHVTSELDEHAIRRWWCAMDYGFTHYTVVHLLGQDYNGAIWVVDEHAARQWLVKRNAEAVAQMLGRHGLGLWDLTTFVAGQDVFARQGAADGQTIAQQYEACGVTLTPANTDRINGAAEVLDRLGDVDAQPAIAPRLYVHERCARLIECIPALEHDPNRPEDVLKVDTDEEGIGGDDAYDAVRYGVMAASAGAVGYGTNPAAGWRG